MKCKITNLGVMFFYPYGDKGPFQMMRQYIIEAADGRIDMIEEWDEPEILTGEYELSEEALAPIFNRQVELSEEEW